MLIFSIAVGCALGFLLRPAFRILGIIFMIVMLAGVYGCVKGRMEREAAYGPPDELIQPVYNSVNNGDR